MKPLVHDTSTLIIVLCGLNARCHLIAFRIGRSSSCGFDFISATIIE